jgi:outer membrane lipoprotein LolB
VFCAALLAAGCAGLPAQAPVVRTPPVLNDFEFSGRVAVRVDQSRHYANISWRHVGDRDEILLTTPLGQGIAELSRSPAGARLRTADGEDQVAGDWEELALRLFGSRLPLDRLPIWLVGHPPAPSSGWRVDYLEYESSAVDALPTLLEVSAGDIALRLKVNEWNRVR